MRSSIVVVAALALATACGGRGGDVDRMAADTSLLRDLELANQSYPQLDSITALEQELTADPGSAASPSAGQARTSAAATTQRRASTTTTRSTSTSGTARTSTSGSRTTTVSSGTVAQPAGREVIVKNTKRDAAIGAAAGAAIGAATSKDKVKGAVIGGAAGAVVGGIIGNNVDVQKKRVP
jgi:outer membrane lipoprotein SlyB